MSTFESMIRDRNSVRDAGNCAWNVVERCKRAWFRSTIIIWKNGYSCWFVWFIQWFVVIRERYEIVWWFAIRWSVAIRWAHIRWPFPMIAFDEQGFITIMLSFSEWRVFTMPLIFARFRFMTHLQRFPNLNAPSMMGHHQRELFGRIAILR